MEHDLWVNAREIVCLICKSQEHNPVFEYFEPDQYERAVGVGSEGYHRQWVQCKNCGFFYSIYSRDKEVLNRIYESSYRSRNAAWRKRSPEELFDSIISLPPEESETKYRVDWIKKNMNALWQGGLFVKKAVPLNFLDIGGGNGVFAYEFKEEGTWIPHVVDPDENAVFLSSKLKMDFIQSSYRPGLFQKKFDLISLIYVLEHLTEPVSFIQSLKDDLTPGSFVYIEVPDAFCFRALPENHDIFNSCHLWMFDGYTLITFLKGCGLEIFCLNLVKTKRGHYALMALAGKTEGL